MKRRIQLVVLFAIFSQLTIYGQQKGTLILENIAAPSLANSILGEPEIQPIAVYLPPSYYNQPLKRYPVVYFLGGYTDQIATYVSTGEYGGYFMERSMNFNITQGRLREVIMVVVNGYNLLYGSFFHNSPVTGKWEDFVVKDAVRHMDSTYRTIPSVKSRALVGLFMGGNGSLHLSMKNPSVFSIGIGLLPGIISPTGMMETLLFNDVNVIKRMVSIKKDLDALSKPEAHKKYMDTVRYYRNHDSAANFATICSFAYGSAFAPDASKAPYFYYPFTIDSNDSLVKDTAVFKMYENGFGNLKAKVALYKDSLLKLNGYAIDYSVNDPVKWITNASIYLDSLLTNENIPHKLLVNKGGHGDQLKDRTENVLLPFCDSLLTFDTKHLSGNTLIEKITFAEQASEPLIDTLQKIISVTFKTGAKLNNIKPIIYLSPGAIISPAKGIISDFTSGSVTYTVTSEGRNKNTIWTVRDASASVVSGTENPIHQNKIKIFPNPANNHFEISVDNSLIYSIEIKDTLGRIIEQKKDINKKSAFVERNNIVSGSYIIKVYTSKGYYVEKLIFK